MVIVEDKVQAQQDGQLLLVDNNNIYIQNITKRHILCKQ